MNAGRGPQAQTGCDALPTTSGRSSFSGFASYFLLLAATRPWPCLGQRSLLRGRGGVCRGRRRPGGRQHRYEAQSAAVCEAPGRGKDSARAIGTEARLVKSVRRRLPRFP
ncbi:hypothetical protein C7M84_004846 [Penaeus vannamei]|uniref:Uncharacterized protein n=1 Tax=Penaeus vannamei TaxID=6689 RepID=A0A3R7PMA4_PENVA|nr:hypothetical protein C7M84_004846 [Penaeus vannamei]